jgi:AraC-like DNA-binding protein
VGEGDQDRRDQGGLSCQWLARGIDDAEIFALTIRKRRRSRRGHVVRCADDHHSPIAGRRIFQFERLTAPGSGTRKIADIALEAGLSGVSYIQRLFRARFGDTPTGVRGER